ncbi:phenoloxidase 2 [Anabrus simplex]|uniref:phenoloxidase 2 n=1 Tax=Anabrus simplex TaxID=316456 RepID=UPI0035A29855
MRSKTAATFQSTFSMGLVNMCVYLGLLFLVGQCLAQNALNDKNTLLYLMDRPLEPLFYAKGANKEVLFQVPSEYLSDQYRPFASDLENRFGAQSEPGATAVNIPSMSLPDLSLPKRLRRDELFSTFVPLHRKMAERLVEVFLGMRSLSDFITAAALTRDSINPGLWTFAMSIAMLHRNDTQNVDLPPVSALLPEKFFDRAVFTRARQDINILEGGERIPIEIPRDYTATDVEIEHRVAYFREDMGINLHHWTWHLVYPFGGPLSIVNKDRRGELWYYQHQQIIARYDFERLCNRLGRVKPFNNFRDVLEEGYFPKLDSLVASRVWPPRFENTKLRDVNRAEQELVFTIQDLERWRDRIYEAIHENRARNTRGENVDLSGPNGIDILGNIIESSSLSINTNLYGNLHNLGHFAISIVHDPDHRHLETFGVMGDLATAMRDPAFYRFHKFIDDMFQDYKATQPRYTVQELGFEGVNVRGVEVLSNGGRMNEFNTFWEQSDVELSRGLDIAPRGPLFARITHLQHAPFMYRIQVENTGQQRMGTVRIFMAPKFDERGVPYVLRQQRILFIEMDKFQTMLRRGSNTIERRSTESSITIPYERTFRRLDATKQTPDDQQFNYCGCGWPQHLLVPKGSSEGFPVELFVMVTNYADDRVDQPEPAGCRAGHSYCGLFNRRYPDRKPMGFPFDRNPRQGAETLRQFLTPNMFVADMTIRFSDRTQVRNGTARIQTTNRRGSNVG